MAGEIEPLWASDALAPELAARLRDSVRDWLPAAALEPTTTRSLRWISVTVARAVYAKVDAGEQLDEVRRVIAGWVASCDAGVLFALVDELRSLERMREAEHVAGRPAAQLWDLGEGGWRDVLRELFEREDQSLRDSQGGY